MSFRKTVRSRYFPPLSFHGFGEFKFKPSMSGPSSQFVTRSFESMKDISDSSLPMMSLDTVVKSGQPIAGSVSFRPSDPALIESSVHSRLASFIESHPSDSESPVNSPADED